MKLPEELLRHILDECDFIIEKSDGKDIEDFLSDETMKRAFARYGMGAIDHARSMVYDRDIFGLAPNNFNRSR